MALHETDFKKMAVCNAGRIVEGATAVRYMPRRYGLLSGKHLSKSTCAGFVDTGTGKWLIQLDNAHKGVKTPHININHQLTRVRDPHIQIPSSVVKGGEMATKAMSAVGVAAFAAFSSTVGCIGGAIGALFGGVGTDFNKTAVRNAGRFAEGATAVRYMPRRYGLLSGKHLSKSTRAGILDTVTGKWLIRLDNVHKGVKTPHININYQLTRVRDPHIPIPGSVVKGGEMATKALNAIGVAVFVTAVVVDAYRIGEAVYSDCTKTEKKLPGKHTAKTTASVAGGWTGGCVGAMACSSTGAYIGGAIGAAFGGVGAVPGAAIGSLIGAVVGGVGGGLNGSRAAEALVEDLASDPRRMMVALPYLESCYCKITSYIPPSFFDLRSFINSYV